MEKLPDYNPAAPYGECMDVIHRYWKIWKAKQFDEKLFKRFPKEVQNIIQVYYLDDDE